MKFNKIGIIALSAIFVATSCNQNSTLSYDKALEWVDKHYKEADVTKAKAGQIKADFTGTTGTILSGIKELLSTLHIELDENNKADDVVDAKVLELTPTMYMTAPNFKGRFEGDQSEGFVFAVKNNSFIITAERSDKEDPKKSSGVLNWEENYNSKCALTKISMSIKDLKDEETGDVGNGYFTVTYSY